MVSIETVDTDTHIEQQALDGELILDVHSHIDRFVCTYAIGLVAVGIFFREELFDVGFGSGSL